MAGGIATTIDVGPVARPFRWVRLANYFMIVGCGTWLAGDIVNLHKFSSGQLPTVLFLDVVLLINVWIGFKVAGRIDRFLWLPQVIALSLLAFGAGWSATALYRIMPDEVRAEINPSGNAIYTAMVLVGAMALSAIAALLAIARLYRSRIEALGFGPRQLAAALAMLEVKPEHMLRARHASLTRACLYGAVAAVILVGQYYIPDDIWQPNALILTPVPLAGWALLFHARRYLQPDALSLLATDGRPPNLFLRSFMDDEQYRFWRSELSVVDFGIETRLAAMLRPIGPFIAIGSPDAPTPRPSASTAILSKNEWQHVVKDWMRQAHTIVLMPGTTHWVNWELGQVFSAGYQSKLIVVMPRSRSWFRSVRDRDASERLAKMSEVLVATAWAGALSRIDRPQDVRAIVFRPDGNVAIVTSRPRNRDSFHLAAMVGQYLLIQQAPGSAPKKSNTMIAAP